MGLGKIGKFFAQMGAAAGRRGTPNGEVVMVVTWSPTLNIGVTFGGRHHWSSYHYGVGLKVGVRAPGHIFVKPQAHLRQFEKLSGCR